MCFGGGSRPSPNNNPAPYSTQDAWKQVGTEQSAATPEQLARIREESGGTAQAPSGQQTSVPLLGRSLKGM